MMSLCYVVYYRPSPNKDSSVICVYTDEPKAREFALEQRKKPGGVWAWYEPTRLIGNK